MLYVDDAQGDAVNLSGYSADAQLRKSYYSTTANNFTVTITNEASGEITMSMPAANTANLSPSRYYYDLLITAGDGTKTRVIEGIATVSPSVTR